MFSRGQIMVKLATEKNKGTCIKQPGKTQFQIQGKSINKITKEVNNNNNSCTSENVSSETIQEPCRAIGTTTEILQMSCSANEIEIKTAQAPRSPREEETETIENVSSGMALGPCSAVGTIETLRTPYSANEIHVEKEIEHELCSPKETSKEFVLDQSSEIDKSDINSDFSDFVDYNDVEDPDWQPAKKKRGENVTSSSSESESEIRLENTEVTAEAESEMFERYMEVNADEDSEMGFERSDEVNTDAVPIRTGRQIDIVKRNKKLRMQGKRYLGYGKNSQGKKTYCIERAGRLLEPRPCGKRCDKGWGGMKFCSFDEEARARIFECFWQNMTWGEKRVYVISLVEKTEVVRKVTEKDKSRRKYSYTYFLKINERRMKVCKSFFLATLGLKEDTVYNWLQETPSGHGIPETDSREEPTVATPNRLNTRAMAVATEFLRNIPKLPSHYCRADSKKEYLESSFSCITDLHKAYKQYSEERQEPLYQITQFTKLFNDMNLSFFKPKKDQCDLCCGYKVGIVDNEQYQCHIRRKNEAATAKATDKELAQNNQAVKVITMDLQSLLLCPKLKASVLYYKTKLCCYNFTLFDLVTKDALCYFWNETATDLCASTFASCITDYLESLDLEGVEKVILYSDGCTYQNRNATLANALVNFAMEKGVVLEQKYLEKGHTYMECDSIHASIERKLRHKDIFVPQQYVDLISQARHIKPYRVKYVDHEFFRDFTGLKYYSSIRPGSVVGAPVVTDLRLLTYNIDGSTEYKLNYSDSEYSPISKPRSCRSARYEIRQMNTQPLLLKKAKFEHLQQIKTVIPKDYHSFYDMLPHHV